MCPPAPPAATLRAAASRSTARTSSPTRASSQPARPHHCDLTRLFDGQLKLSVTSDELVNAAAPAASARTSKRWFGSKLFEKVEQAATVVVTTVETTVTDAVDEAEKLIKTVVATIVTAAGEMFDAVLQTVEDAANFVAATLRKIGAKIKDLIDYLKSLFEWDDILKRQRVLEEYLRQLHPWTKETLNRIEGVAKKTLHDLKDEVECNFDRYIELLGSQSSGAQVEEVSTAPPQDIQSSYVKSLFSHNFTKVGGDPAALASSRSQELYGALSQALNLTAPKNMVTQAQDMILRTNLLNLLSDLAKLTRDGAAELLNAMRGLIKISWQVADAIVDVIFEFMEAMPDELFALCETRINIPILTSFYEKVIMRGQGAELNILSLAALAAAIPLTVTYKSVTGKDDSVFSDAEYQEFHNTPWQNYIWLNGLTDAALDDGAQQRGLAVRSTGPAWHVKLMWAGSYAYAVSVGYWGVAAAFEDIPAVSALKSSQTPECHQVRH